jgi:hypothetical protein
MNIVKRMGAISLFVAIAALPSMVYPQTTISNLPVATTLTGTEAILADQGTCSTCTVKISPTQISNFVQISSGMTSRNAGQVFVAASGDTSGVADLANIQAAAAALASSDRLPPLASSFFATAKIILGPGTFYFAQSNIGLLPATSQKTVGFWLQGSGRGLTSIDYNPITSGPMFTNNHWLDVKMTDITFVGHDPSSDFMWSQEQAGLTNVQDYTFQDDEWAGSWGTLFRLTGGNNNSEWKFERATVAGSIVNWIYTPPAVATTIISGSNTVFATNTAGQVKAGDTGSFSAAVSPLLANTQYYVVSATPTSFQVATTPGGTPVAFTANSTPNFSTASDQFLNFWFHQCKFDTGTSLGQWINMSFGGSIKIKDCDISGHNPASVAYVFNLLGSAHANGVMNFEVDGLRVEHSGNNSRLIHSQWGGGSIIFRNLDESSQSGLRNITNPYANYEIINSAGPLITYTNSQLMGVHAYTNNVNNYNLQNDILYQQVTLLDNPTAANFVTVASAGNSGGLPRIRFSKCRNTLNSATVGYHEICDTDLYWNQSLGGQTDTKQISCVGANSDWPTGGGSFQFRLPLNAMITRVRFWNPAGSGAGGAFQYIMQTTESIPTILAGGPATPMAGTNASTPIPASSMYVTTPNFMMTSDAARTIVIQDTQSGGRTGVYTGLDCLIDYIG